VAFITGGASGIGLGMAEAFAEKGMKVAIADMDQPALTKSAEQLEAKGANVIAIPCDVTNATSVDEAAAATLRAFGKVHVVCNNAGVNPLGALSDIRLIDWRWVLDVNVMGVVHGIKTFLPILQRQGEGGHFVNTCSAIGLAQPNTANGGFSPYLASKYAVVGLSEKLAFELAPQGIGVSMLCPSFVRTNLTASDRVRPDHYRGEEPGATDAERARHASILNSGLEPLAVGRQVVSGILDKELYILTHANIRADVERRFNTILGSFDRLNTSPAKG
jgi:NAD(P)-dependent dehydrogenase (short-subunit alcohol dehydrogenase family)